MNEAQAQAPAPAPAGQVSQTMVLVHGAGHGAWCWFKVVPVLRSSGYNATVIDLGASGINPLQISDITNISDYFQPLMNLFEALPTNEKVILVGHSYDGFTISSVMERFPNKIACAVFIAALMPGPSLNASTVYQAYSARQGSTLDSIVTPKSITFGPIFAKEKLYNKRPVEDWTLATTLIRPHPVPSNDDLSSSVLALTKQNYGRIKRVYILSSEEDMALKIDVQKFMVQNNPPNQILQIADSDHMVMFSKSNELSTLLLQIAQT